MDDLKFNKVAAGFLMAGLIAMGGYKISEILVPHQNLAENSYPIEISQQVAFLQRRRAIWSRTDSGHAG